MAGNIKGITIELDGDTSKLDQAISKTEKSVKSVNGELRNVNNLLKFNPGNTDLLAQKQQLLSKQIENTGSKLNTLKDAQSQVKRQFESGDLGEEKYRAFQREVIATESKLNTYKSQLKASQNEEKSLKEETSRLSSFFEATGRKVDDFSDILGPKMTNKIREGKASSSELKTAINQIGRTVTTTESDFKNFNKVLSSINDGGSIDKIKKDLDSLGNESQSTLEKIKSNTFVQKMGTVANGFKQVGDVAKQSATKAVTSGNEFTAISNSMIKQTGRTGDSAKDMQNAFNNIYGTTVIPDSAVLGDTLVNVTKRFGLQGKALEDVTKKIVTYGKATNQDSATATNNLADVMQKFNIKAEDSGSVMDALTAGYQKGTFQAGELENAVSSASPYFGELGLSVESSIGLIAKWNSVGIESNEVLGGFRKARQNLTKDGGDFNQGLQDTYNALKNAKTQTEANSIASEVFGNKVGPSLATAIKQGRMSLDDLKGGAEDTSGTLSKTMGALDSTSGAEMAKQTQAMNLEFAKLGQEIQRAVLPFLKQVTPIVQKVAQYFANLDPNLRSAIVGVGGVATAFALMSPIIVSTISAVGSMKKAFDWFKKLEIIPNLMKLGTVIAGISWPVWAVIGAIVAVIAIIMNWGTIVDWFKGVFAGLGVWIGQVVDNIKNFISGLVSWFNQAVQNVQNFFTSIYNFIQPVLNAIGNFIMSYINFVFNFWKSVFNVFVTVVQTIWNIIQTVITYAIAIVATIIITTLNGIMSVWNAIWGFLAPIVQTVFDTISNVVSTAINFVLGIINTYLNFIVQTWTTIWNTLVSVFEPIFNAVSQIIQTVLDTVVNIITTVTSTISSVWNTVWSGISSFFETIWNGIVTAFNVYISTVQNIVSTVLNTISNVWNTVWGGISSFFTTIWNGIVTTVTTVINTVQNVINSVWNGIKTTTENVWNGIKNAIQGPIENAKNIVKGIIDTIKGFFNFKISWPHIPMPHFGINPPGWQIGDLLKGSIPTLDISWHANGGIFNKPTLFTDGGGGVHGVGEAGPEAILPLNEKTLSQIGKAIAENTDTSNSTNINLTVYGEMNTQTAKQWAVKISEQLEQLNKNRKLGG